MATGKETQDLLTGLVLDHIREGDRSEKATLQLIQHALYTVLGGSAAEIDAVRSRKGIELAEQEAPDREIAWHHTEALTRRNLAFIADSLTDRIISLDTSEVAKPGERPTLAPVPSVESLETNVA